MMTVHGDEGDDGTSVPNMPERRSDPRDDLTGWEKPPFMCGCLWLPKCTSWSEHYARRAADERAAMKVSR